jgi:hypothetical protein
VAMCKFVFDYVWVCFVICFVCLFCTNILHVNSFLFDNYILFHKVYTKAYSVQSIDMASMLKLCSHIGTLKHLRRTGWVRCNVDQPETIASHMYRMAVLGTSYNIHI